MAVANDVTEFYARNNPRQKTSVRETAHASVLAAVKANRDSTDKAKTKKITFAGEFATLKKTVIELNTTFKSGFEDMAAVNGRNTRLLLIEATEIKSIAKDVQLLKRNAGKTVTPKVAKQSAPKKTKAVEPKPIKEKETPFFNPVREAQQSTNVKPKVAKQKVTEPTLRHATSKPKGGMSRGGKLALGAVTAGGALALASSAFAGTNDDALPKFNVNPEVNVNKPPVNNIVQKDATPRPRATSGTPNVFGEYTDEIVKRIKGFADDAKQGLRRTMEQGGTYQSPISVSRVTSPKAAVAGRNEVGGYAPGSGGASGSAPSGWSISGSVRSAAGATPGIYRGSVSDVNAPSGRGMGGSSGASGSSNSSPSKTSAVNKNLPPEARALLDTIASSESNSYSIIYGGKSFSSFADHPRIAVPIRNGPNQGKTSSAAGRYQFLGTTWDTVKREAGLKDFSPESQDAGAWYQAQKVYKSKTKRDLLTDLRSKDPAVLAGVSQALHSEWTSLPGGIEQGQSSNVFNSRFAANLTKQSGTYVATENPTTPHANQNEVGGHITRTSAQEGSTVNGKAISDETQLNRPRHYGGTITVGGETFSYGSGDDTRGRGSSPYGDKRILGYTPKELRASRGQLAMDSFEVEQEYDPKTGDKRAGVLLHQASGTSVDTALTAGCFGIVRQDWPRFKEALRQKIAEEGPQVLHVNPDGTASITSVKTGQTDQSTNMIADAKAGNLQPSTPSIDSPGTNDNGTPNFSARTNEQAPSYENASQLAQKLKKTQPWRTDKECVSLAKEVVGSSGSVASWRRGTGADSGSLVRGTPIATFVNEQGGQEDRYGMFHGRQTTGIHSRDLRKQGITPYTHAAVFDEYGEQNGVKGFYAYERYQGAGVHRKFYSLDDKRGGEYRGSNYAAINEETPEGVRALGGENNPITQAKTDVKTLSHSVKPGVRNYNQADIKAPDRDEDDNSLASTPTIDNKSKSKDKPEDVGDGNGNGNGNVSTAVNQRHAYNSEDIGGYFGHDYMAA